MALGPYYPTGHGSLRGTLAGPILESTYLQNPMFTVTVALLSSIMTLAHILQQYRILMVYRGGDLELIWKASGA